MITNIVEETIDTKHKLYIVTHSHLSSGYQTAQVAHATAEFVLNHPEVARQWHLTSNYIIALEADDENHLIELAEEAEKNNIKTTIFREPDLLHEMTAVTFEPSFFTKNLLKDLPLVGRKMKNQNVLKNREREFRQQTATL